MIVTIVWLVVQPSLKSAVQPPLMIAWKITTCGWNRQHCQVHDHSGTRTWQLNRMSRCFSHLFPMSITAFPERITALLCCNHLPCRKIRQRQASFSPDHAAWCSTVQSLWSCRCHWQKATAKIETQTRPLKVFKSVSLALSVTFKKIGVRLSTMISLMGLPSTQGDQVWILSCDRGTNPQSQ